MASKRKHYTFNIQVDYYDDPEGDKEREKAIRTGSLPQPTGSFWQWSISEFKDADGKEIKASYVVQRETGSANGGLKGMLKDVFNFLPRFLDENGLPSK